MFTDIFIHVCLDKHIYVYIYISVWGRLHYPIGRARASDPPPKDRHYRSWLAASSLLFNPLPINQPFQTHATTQLIKSKGCKAGLVFNPATPIDLAK